MRNGNLIGLRIAIKSLTSHPMRLGLAVLSITIGVASVIVLVGIGRGAEQEVRSTIERMGKNLIVVSAGRSRVIKGQLGEIGMKKTLTLRDATAIAKECPSVRRIAPAYAKKLPVRFEDMTHSTKIVGTVPSIRNVRNLALQSGSLFDDAENRLMAPVAVLGPTVVESLFGGRHPVGSSILIGKVSFKVIGVTRPKGAVSGEDQDDQVLVPLRTVMRKLVNVTYLSHIFVEARGSDDMYSAAEEIKTLLRERHRLREDREDDFVIQNEADILEAQSSVARTFNILVVGIAASSLLIGGVGILGVMLLSVQERTAEIGIRRAVGAKKIDILRQFILEASVLGISGGISGLFIGLGTSVAAELIAGMPVVLKPDYVILSLGVSLATGLIFGIFPAWKAARLDPIDALHTEA
jgi:putative ABC transport system permease protein